MKVSQNYPDISDILQRKAEGRREIAARTFGEKIAMVEAMRERLAPFNRLKEQRKNKQRAAPER
ncbi:hypothetical protein MHY1_p00122 (plasmid) [Methylovirgula sp. HY1]|nr:hypothetical protein MHY1_p00122 [Methylovirgula sp. HY1]